MAADFKANIESMADEGRVVSHAGKIVAFKME